MQYSIKRLKSKIWFEENQSFDTFNSFIYCEIENTPDQDAEEKKAAGPFIPLKTSPKAKRPKTAFINSARTKRTSWFQKKKEESESDESSRSSSSKSSSVESSKKSEAKKTPKPQLPKVAPGKGKNATANK